MTLQSTESQRLITADQWLAQAYPHRDRLHADIAGRLARRTPIPINAADKAVFGLVFEHALGLDLAVEPPVRLPVRLPD